MPMDETRPPEKDPNESDNTQTGHGSAAPDARVGNYRLLERLGAGGMGEVWLAEQTGAVRRRVAVKVVKAGLDTATVIARFEAERQALAVMDHPAIAKVFDAGSTEQGRPYFAMEYVQGESVIEYCDRHRLTIKERLELFIQVCDGVQHAHQKGIIHRDLKPSNILVSLQNDRAAAKIIDFGISKATNQALTSRTLHTVFGGFIGTPEYMSPEQAEVGVTDVDTRSDIYALGVVLYELLTGVLPLTPDAFADQGLDAIRRTIREVDPPRPSTRVTRTAVAGDDAAARRRSDPSRLAARLKGDLDWIVLKALEKERTKRYQTANAFALDVKRHLADEPVAAGPPSATYRMGKFVRRHKTPVGAAVLLLAVLLGFSAVTAVQAARIARERDRANREAQTAEQIVAFLVGLFNISDPSEARGKSITAREMLDRGADDIDRTLAGQPEVQARLQATMGRVYMNLGFYQEAHGLFEKAVASYRRVAGEDHRSTMAALSGLADAEWLMGKVSNAESIYRELAARQERVLGREHPDTLKTKFDLASAYALGGRLAEAEALTRETLEIQRARLGREHADTLATLNNLGAILHRQQRHDAELPVTAEVLDIRRRVLGPDHPDTLRSYNNMGINYIDLGRWVDAEQVLSEAVNGRRRVLGDTHPGTQLSVMNLATAYQRQKKYAEAEREFLRVASQLGVEPGQQTSASVLNSEGARPDVAKHLSDLYTEWGQPEKAAAWKASIRLAR